MPPTSRTRFSATPSSSTAGSTRWSAIIGLAILLALGLLAFLAWRQMTSLQSTIGALGEQVEELGEQVSEAEGRARQAEEEARQAAGKAAEAASAAVQAEQEKEEAEREASLAEERAELAESEAIEALTERETAEQARLEAEEASEAARVEAELAREQAKIAEIEAESLRRQREEELDRLQEALQRIAETRRTAMGLVMNLSGDAIEFDFDRAQLRSEDRELLSRIVGILQTAAADYQVQIFGHTDDIGSDEYNLELSRQRAEAVRDYLVEAGLDPDIMTTRGFGKSKPLVQGTDAEARQRNRRVEIAIIQSELQFQAAPEEDG